MFAAIRRGVDVPREDTDTHLRSRIVRFVLQIVQFFFPLLKLCIMGNYEHIDCILKNMQKRREMGL